jgi:hypothetical protein
MIKKIVIGLAALLVACDSHIATTQVGGHGGQESCDRVSSLSRSPACGWSPVPRGELHEEICESPHTLISKYHDGRYGLYEERTPNSEQCGFMPVVFEVFVNDEFGDRFKPAVLEVVYEVRGEPAEWDYDAGDLRAERIGDELNVYGNGEDFQQEVLINNEPFMVQFSPEPRCARQEGRVDCLGYSYSGTSEGLIYYGEDDDQIVTVDLVLLLYRSACEKEGSRSFLCGDDVDMDKYQRRVDKYNSVMERSGVFLRFRLKDVKVTPSAGLTAGLGVIRYLEADIGLGLDIACPNTRGCAYPNTKYDKAGYGISLGGWTTDLHELGHVAGLAHGPENSSYAASGYLFAEFGHGWSANPCNREGDIMSYNVSSYVFFNSKLVCMDVWGVKSEVDSYVTERSYADSAYHWNRVRYDLSLIHDEHNEGTVLALQEIEIEDDLPVILD